MPQQTSLRILEHFATLDDPRIERSKEHLLIDIVSIAICAVICGADNWVEVAAFGRSKKKWWRRFLKLANGVPSHDTFWCVFRALDPSQFEQCFLSWVQALMRLTDGEIVALGLFGIPMLVLALAVRLTSPGPILFRQQRIGKHGKTYYMLKFRSMRVDADAQMHRDHVRRLIRENTRPGDIVGRTLKLQLDPRVTPLGRVMRALSLDELPQLFNVLHGEMSLVGPRPPLPYEYELYSERAKHRLSVLPGITGYWQVTARNRVSFNEMVQLDLDYISQMSLGLDLWIMLLTPLEMLRGVGAG